jgi:amino acid transporter
MNKSVRHESLTTFMILGMGILLCLIGTYELKGLDTFDVSNAVPVADISKQTLDRIDNQRVLFLFVFYTSLFIGLFLSFIGLAYFFKNFFMGSIQNRQNTTNLEIKSKDNIQVNKFEEPFEKNKIKYKFTFFGLQPNEYSKGAIFLIYLGLFNVVAYFSMEVILKTFDINSVFALITGLLFIILGIFYYKNLKPCIYIAIVIWSLSIVAALQHLIWDSNRQIYIGVFFFRSLLLWVLIKSTPLYHTIYEKEGSRIL